MKPIILILALAFACAVYAAKTFNGASNGSAVQQTLGYPLSFACWAYPTATNGNYCLTCIQSNGGGGRLLIGITSGKWRVDAGGSADATNGADSALGAWAHVAVVAESPSNRSIFVDGVKYGPNTVTGATVMVPRHINVAQRYSAGFGQFFPGVLSDMAWWNVALTDEQIAALATGKRPDNVAPTVPVLYLRMQDTTSNEFSVTGTNYIVVLTNNPSVHAAIIPRQYR